VAVELAGSSAQQIDQIGRPMERVGDAPAVTKRKRREELSVAFGEQDGLLQTFGAVKRGQPGERSIVAG
jgi:hypothetical protein